MQNTLKKEAKRNLWALGHTAPQAPPYFSSGEVIVFSLLQNQVVSHVWKLILKKRKEEEHKRCRPTECYQNYCNGFGRLWKF